MNNEEKRVYQNLFHKYDRNKNNLLEYGEFYLFFKVAMAINVEELYNRGIPEEPPQADISASYVKYIFNGIDFMGKQVITIDDAVECVFMIKSQDPLYQAKISFRALDKDRSRVIEVSEIRASTGLFGHSSIETKFLSRLENALSANSDRLQFYEYYNLLFGQEIEPTYDPYDGKIPKASQSSCCYLL